MDTNESNLCRICLNQDENGNFIPIFPEFNEIALQIYQISEVKVSDNDTIPAIICSECLSELNGAINFRRKCIEADETYFLRCSRFQDLEEVQKSDPTEDSSQIYEETSLQLIKPEIIEGQSFSETIQLETYENKNNLCETIIDVTEPTLKKLKRNYNRKKKEETKRLYQCPKCPKVLSSKAYLQVHVCIKHTYVDQKDLLFCDLCPANKKTKSLMRAHINSVHMTRPKEKFTCSKCGKSSLTPGALYSHEKTHEDVSPDDYPICSFCNKKFKQKRFLKEHIRLVHEKSRAFPCPYCPHVSSCSGSFNKHYKAVHLKWKPHKCSFCTLSFCTNQQLIRHNRIHNGDRPFPCQFCSKPFADSNGKRRHQKICPQRKSDS